MTSSVSIDKDQALKELTFRLDSLERELITIKKQDKEQAIRELIFRLDNLERSFNVIKKRNVDLANENKIIKRQLKQQHKIITGSIEDLRIVKFNMGI